MPTRRVVWPSFDELLDSKADRSQWPSHLRIVSEFLRELAPHLPKQYVTHARYMYEKEPRPITNSFGRRLFGTLWTAIRDDYGKPDARLLDDGRKLLTHLARAGRHLHLKELTVVPSPIPNGLPGFTYTLGKATIKRKPTTITDVAASFVEGALANLDKLPSAIRETWRPLLLRASKVPRGSLPSRLPGLLTAFLEILFRHAKPGRQLRVDWKKAWPQVGGLLVPWGLDLEITWTSPDAPPKVVLRLPKTSGGEYVHTLMRTRAPTRPFDAAAIANRIVDYLARYSNRYPRPLWIEESGTKMFLDPESISYVSADPNVTITKTDRAQAMKLAKQYERAAAELVDRTLKRYGLAGMSRPVAEWRAILKELGKRAGVLSGDEEVPHRHSQEEYRPLAREYLRRILEQHDREAMRWIDPTIEEIMRTSPKLTDKATPDLWWYDPKSDRAARVHMKHFMPRSGVPGPLLSKARAALSRLPVWARPTFEKILERYPEGLRIAVDRLYRTAPKPQRSHSEVLKWIKKNERKKKTSLSLSTDSRRLATDRKHGEKHPTRNLYWNARSHRWVRKENLDRSGGTAKVKADRAEQKRETPRKQSATTPGYASAIEQLRRGAKNLPQQYRQLILGAIERGGAASRYPSQQFIAAAKEIATQLRMNTLGRPVGVEEGAIYAWLKRVAQNAGVSLQLINSQHPGGHPGLSIAVIGRGGKKSRIAILAPESKHSARSRIDSPFSPDKLRDQLRRRISDSVDQITRPVVVGDAIVVDSEGDVLDISTARGRALAHAAAEAKDRVVKYAMRGISRLPRMVLYKLSHELNDDMGGKYPAPRSVQDALQIIEIWVRRQVTKLDDARGQRAVKAWLTTQLPSSEPDKDVAEFLPMTREKRKGYHRIRHRESSRKRREEAMSRRTKRQAGIISDKPAIEELIDYLHRLNLSQSEVKTILELLRRNPSRGKQIVAALRASMLSLSPHKRGRTVRVHLIRLSDYDKYYSQRAAEALKQLQGLPVHVTPKFKRLVEQGSIPPELVTQIADHMAQWSHRSPTAATGAASAPAIRQSDPRLQYAQILRNLGLHVDPTWIPPSVAQRGLKHATLDMTTLPKRTQNTAAFEAGRTLAKFLRAVGERVPAARKVIGALRKLLPK